MKTYKRKIQLNVEKFEKETFVYSVCNVRERKNSETKTKTERERDKKQEIKFITLKEQTKRGFS